MIVPLILLLLLVFIQSSLLPFDLIIIVIIVRSFLFHAKSNYYLALLLGLIVSLSSGQPLGVMSVIYLLVVHLVHWIRQATFASHWSFSLPITLFVLVIYYLINQFLFGVSLNYWNIPIQLIFVVPLYLLIGFWEERFVGRSVIKLRL